jgi:16S rRNA (guanine966-N2)-methyltransferase
MPGPRRRQPQSVRILGGTWRGRRLSFPPADGLRPTPDRVRETLFNWVRPTLVGMRCLDLYAGTGALGIEALSQGAASCTFVERDPLVARALTENLERLGAEGYELLRTDAALALDRQGGTFDLVFLDPPFGRGLIPELLDRLRHSERLADVALVYVEAERDQAVAGIPGWRVLSSGKAGQVGFHLLEMDHG